MPWYSFKRHTMEEFADGLWAAEGPNVRDMGFLFSTRMAIAKLADGAVWVNSPVPAPFHVLTNESRNSGLLDTLSRRRHGISGD